jgi:hypothetical protein
MLAEAVMEAAGQRVFVLNLVSQDGETMGMQGGHHLAALEKHAGIVGPSVVIAHRGELDVPEGHEAMTIDPDVAAESGWRVIHADIADEFADWPAHDPHKLGRILEGLQGES